MKTLVRRQQRKFFAILGIALLSGCVSVNLGAGHTEKANGVDFVEPQKPFERVKLENADQAWQNPNNGNTISFLSECYSPTETHLKTLEMEISQVLREPVIESSQEIQYNQRGALRSRIQGTLDGVPTKIELVLFKKNNCTYTLSYVSVTSHFERGLKPFEEFLSQFRAP